MAIEPRPTTTEPRSRRAILAGALTGLAAVIAGRVAAPDNAEAASGDPLILGALTNNSGTTGTKLSTNGSDTGLYVQQNGTGTALRGLANNGIAGFFTSSNGTGVSGVTAKNDQFGVYGANDAVTNGGGEAIRANGQQNDGLVATTAYGAATGVRAINTGNSGTAIFGRSTDTTGLGGVGVSGQADSDQGSGIYGFGSFTSGTPKGVSGETSAPAGNGVFGRMTAGTFGGGAAVGATGYQNHGVLTSTLNAGAYAVNATNFGAGGTAIRGEATGTSGSTNMGVHGEISGDGYAVYGHAAAGGDGGGVYGKSDGTAGIGATGYAASTTGATTGVYGLVASTDGTAVLGYAAGNGVNYGVFGQVFSVSGYGVYSAGKAHVEGALSVSGAITAGTKDFKIDHPLDPASKFLSHSCVESDDRRTVYDGEVSLDAKGEATVTLPAWFGALNRDPRYQLTAIGAAAPDLHLKTKVANNEFVVAGGNAGQLVCWQVSAIRQDAYAKAHPLAVEAAKTGTEKGRYLHPEVYGKAASKSIGALHVRSLPATPAAPSRH